MFARSRWWWIYRRRVFWYLALPLPALLLPECLFDPLRVYVVGLLSFVVLAFLGLNTGLFEQIRFAAPRSPAWGRFEWGSGAIGVALTAGGCAASMPLLCLVGFTWVTSTAEVALWIRESDMRQRLKVRDARRRR
jgi:hypothetical protein